MEKTKKIARGLELEILLIAGLLLPVLAGAALCLFQFFAPNAPNAEAPPIRKFRLVKCMASPFID